MGIFGGKKTGKTTLRSHVAKSRRRDDMDRIFRNHPEMSWDNQRSSLTWLAGIFLHSKWKVSMGKSENPSSIPSGQRLRSELERSTMLLMGKSTISTGPFSIVCCMFTRGSMTDFSWPCWTAGGFFRLVKCENLSSDNLLHSY